MNIMLEKRGAVNAVSSRNVANRHLVCQNRPKCTRKAAVTVNRFADGRPKTDEDWRNLNWQILNAFSPGAPIDELELLAGRSAQIDRMLDTVAQRGLHAILYGERGVGKSSLANTFASRLLGGARVLTCIPVNCHPTDDYSAVWRKVFRRLSREGGQDIAQSYPGLIDPDEVVLELASFHLNTIPIVILDEFDKLPNKEVRNLIANTIKNLSDRSVRTTVIVVGVADSVSGLIDEHESLSRCLRQILMQRMASVELRQIVAQRLPPLGMAIQPDALDYIVALSRGLPHYTHMFGQQAAKVAAETRELMVDVSHVERAVPVCIEETAQTIREQYHTATISPRKGNIYKEVLLAAALVRVDDLGYFQPADLRNALGTLLKKVDAPVSLFGQHLKNLCEPDRGAILEQVGSDRKYRYRFAEPMMQPFVLLQGLRNRMITRQQVNELAATYYQPMPSSGFRQPS